MHILFMLLAVGAASTSEVTPSYNKAMSEAQMYSRIADSHMWLLGSQSAQADVCHVLGDAIETWLMAAQWYEKALKSPAAEDDTARLSEASLTELIDAEKAKAESTHAYYEQTCR